MTPLDTLKALTLAQIIHILVLILAGLASLFAYYNDMRDSGAVSLVIGVITAIGLVYSTPSPPAGPPPVISLAAVSAIGA